MRRLKDFTYPDMHEVVLVQRPRRRFAVREDRREWDQTISVLIDGQPICMTSDATVTVETGPGHAGSVVTIQVLAASVDCARLPKGWK